MLSSAERSRYQRQLILPEFGETGQLALKAASVLVVGAGGLGCPVLTYLAAAGVGVLGVVDADVVSMSNLHRQVLYTVSDVGRPKVEVASKRLQVQNPLIKINAHHCHLHADNAMEIISLYDIVVDGSDNFPTRYLVNDACVLLNKILVYGAIHQYEGQVSVFNHSMQDGSRGPNYRDLFPQPPLPNEIPNCDEAGVLGVLPGIIGCLQANETIKIILGQNDVLAGELLIFDANSASTIKIKISKSARNPLRGEDAITALIDYEEFCGIVPVPTISLKKFLDLNEPYVFIDVREVEEFKEAPSKGKNIPLSTLSARVNEIAVDKLVIFICRSGQRSEEAIRMLNGMNLTGDWYNLEGGMERLYGL